MSNESRPRGSRPQKRTNRQMARSAPPYKPPPPPPAEEVEALVTEISQTLSEENVAQLKTAIEIIGLERARTCLSKAIEIEENGGMMIISGKRRRTPGGVFFYMVRTDASKDERRIIFPDLFQEKAKPPSWRECNLYIAKLLKQTQKGTVTKVKLTLIGRPKQVAKAKTCMVAVMEGRPVPESMPKGLPKPPNAGSSFAVFIATKQWNRVADSLKENKKDELIIEGYPIFDPAKQVTAVLAQGVTTKFIQRAGSMRNADSANNGEQSEGEPDEKAVMGSETSGAEASAETAPPSEEAVPEEANSETEQ